MTKEDFNNTKWRNGLEANYRGFRYKIVAVGFVEGLVSLLEDGEDETIWVRFENIELVEPTVVAKPSFFLA